MSDIENMMLGVIERWWASRYSERHGIVTSYDPDKYLAKVTFQPEGQESGWLPIETGHIGNGYGIAIGLQPGAGGAQPGGNGASPGGTSSPNQGDQVVVRFQEGDFESGKIVQRVHSDEDKPPRVESGEIVIWTKFQNSGGGTPDAAQGGQGGTGQKIYLKKDGSISWEDGNGATLTFDGQGNAKLVCNALEVDAAKTIVVNGTQDITVNGSAKVTVTAAAALNLNGKPINFNGGGPTTPPFTVPG